MLTYKTLKSISIADFKKQLGITSLDIFESKAGNRYVVVEGNALMFAQDFDGSKPTVVITVEKTDDETGEVSEFSFIGNERRKIVGAL